MVTTITKAKGRSKHELRRIRGQVTAAIKQQPLYDAKAKEKEDVKISENAKIISVTQPSHNQDATAAAAAVKLSAILKRKGTSEGTLPSSLWHGPLGRKKYWNLIDISVT